MMEGSLGPIISKNFKILWRSKISAIAIVIIPLIVVLLVGIAFSSSSFSSIQVGAYSGDYNNLSQSSLNTIQEKGYDIKKYSSEQLCEKSVKDGETKICIVFPANLSIDTNESIKIYADKSRTDIAYYLINSIQSQISKEASGVGQLEIQKLISVLNEAKQTISSQKENISELNDELSSLEESASAISSQDFDATSLLNNIEDVNESVEDSGLNGTALEDVQDELEDVKRNALDVNDSFNVLSQNSGDLSEEISETKESLEEVEEKLNTLAEKLNSTEIAEAEKIVNPLNTEIKPLKPNSSNWEYLFPKFIFVVILFCGIILASALVVRERKTGALFRNSIASTNDFTFIMGIFITCLIILFLQLSIVLTGVHFIIGTSLNTMVGELALAILVSSSIFIFLGMLIGYAFKSEETTMIVSISLIALFLFFSNAIFPIEAISGNLKNVIQYNPAAISNTLFRKIILFKYTIASVVNEFLILAGSLVVSLFLTLFVKKMSRRRI